MIFSEIFTIMRKKVNKPKYVLANKIEVLHVSRKNPEDRLENAKENEKYSCKCAKNGQSFWGFLSLEIRSDEVYKLMGKTPGGQNQM